MQCNLRLLRTFKDQGWIFKNCYGIEPEGAKLIPFFCQLEIFLAEKEAFLCQLEIFLEESKALELSKDFCRSDYNSQSFQAIV